MVRTSNGRRAEPSPPGAGVQCGSLPGILVVCGVRLYRDGLVDLLEAGDGVTVTGTAATCDEALACCREAPAAALVDAPSAAAAPVAARLRGRWPETKLIALGLYEDPDVVLAYVEAGFDGYVTRTTSLTGLNKTIRRVLDGEAVCSPKIAAALFRRLRAGNPTSHRLSLTPRELEVAELINEGSPTSRSRACCRSRPPRSRATSTTSWRSSRSSAVARRPWRCGAPACSSASEAGRPPMRRRGRTPVPRPGRSTHGVAPQVESSGRMAENGRMFRSSS